VARGKQLAIDTAEVDRFRRDLDALVAPDARVGVAVSGGPDSLALLLLAAAARPGKVEAATVDHALRPESADEAAMVAGVCEKLGVPHETLTVEWTVAPLTAIQERARAERYALLGRWAKEKALTAVLVGHHRDDQAETFLMRLARGAGVRGLAGMRRSVRAPGAETWIVRPLLGWMRSELEGLCNAAGLTPVLDPSNENEQFERIRMRHGLERADWLDPQAVARSAGHLAEADVALQWATTQEWDRAVSQVNGGLTYRPGSTPREIRRRIVRRAVLALAREGQANELRGGELDRLLVALATGRRATLRGVLCTGGAEWRFIPAPNRTRPVDNLR
jgi:tRNA(Ile)-lysidine synthase